VWQEEQNVRRLDQPVTKLTILMIILLMYMFKNDKLPQAACRLIDRKNFCVLYSYIERNKREREREKR